VILSFSMDSLGKRAARPSLGLLGCLWAALAAWLWVGAAAPLDGLSRLAAAAHGSEGHALVSADRGHGHDPAREPPSVIADASESEQEELGDDSELDHDARVVAIHDAPTQTFAHSAFEESVGPRDPSGAQPHNRGPPRA
jgi:hypothetical protein